MFFSKRWRVLFRKKLNKTGIAGIFAASLELTKEGLLNIMQKKSFDKVMIKGRK